MFYGGDRKHKDTTLELISFIDSYNKDMSISTSNALNLNDLCGIVRSIIHCLRNELRMNFIERRVIELCFELCKSFFKSYMKMERLMINNNHHYEMKPMLEWMNSVSLRKI